MDTIHVDELAESLQSYEGMKRMIHMNLGPTHYLIHKIIIGSNIMSRDGTMNFSLRRPKSTKNFRFQKKKKKLKFKIAFIEEIENYINS